MNAVVISEKLDGHLDYVNIRILEHLYVPKAKASTLREMEKDFKKYRLDRFIIKRRLVQLEKYGTLEIVKGTSPLCVWSYPELEQAMQIRIMRGKKYLGVE